MIEDSIFQSGPREENYVEDQGTPRWGCNKATPPNLVIPTIESNKVGSSKQRSKVTELPGKQQVLKTIESSFQHKPNFARRASP